MSRDSSAMYPGAPSEDAICPMVGASMPNSSRARMSAAYPASLRMINLFGGGRCGSPEAPAVGYFAAAFVHALQVGAAETSRLVCARPLVRVPPHSGVRKSNSSLRMWTAVPRPI
jgi:hypothetical protein